MRCGDWGLGVWGWEREASVNAGLRSVFGSLFLVFSCQYSVVSSWFLDLGLQGCGLAYCI